MSRFKFGRNFRLLVQTNNVSSPNNIEFLTIEGPFTIRFDIVRNNMSSANTGKIEVLNLGKSTRSLIFQDRLDPKVYKRVVLQAGYGSKITTIFQGNLFRAYSERKGADVITHLECRDGDYDIRNAQTSRTYNKGVSVKKIVDDLLNSFTFLSRGAISEEGDEETFDRPVVIDNKSFFVLVQNKKGAFVDLEKVNVLDDKEYIDRRIPLFTSDSGLIGTPRRENSFLSIDVIFEPDIVIGQLIEFQSSIQSEYDGQYKVIGIQHQGTISESVGGPLITKLNLLAESQLFGQFQGVS